MRRQWSPLEKNGQLPSAPRHAGCLGQVAMPDRAPVLSRAFRMLPAVFSIRGLLLLGLVVGTVALKGVFVITL